MYDDNGWCHFGFFEHFKCSISFSDNTSMNLLLKRIDGVQGMNDFAQSIGDVSFRQDSDWLQRLFLEG